MYRRTFFLSIIFMTASVSGTAAIAQEPEKDMHRISGELIYLVRIALPPDSVATVELRNAQASEDTPPIAEQKITLNGKQVPVPFSLAVERSKLKPGETYHLYGDIHDGRKQRWTSEAVVIDPQEPDITLGALLLKPSGSTLRLIPVAMEEITGTEWVVEDINGGGIIDRSRVTLTFGEDGRVGGRASCNSYSAGWTENNGRLTVGHAVSTEMACAEALMNQEQKFLSILPDLKFYATTPEGALILQTVDGRRLRAFPAG